MKPASHDPMICCREHAVTGSIDVTLLAQAIHAFNLTVCDCDHGDGIGDCVDRATEHVELYERLAAARSGGRS